VKVTVLYEDSRAPAGAFSFHDPFVLTIVARRLGIEPHSSEDRRLRSEVVARPCRGAGNVLQDASDDRLGPHRIAVFDRDRVGELLPGSRVSCIRGTKTEIARQLGPEADVVLLDRNLETVLQAIRETGRLKLDDEFHRAINGKKRDARESVLRQASRDATLQDEVVARVASLDYLVGRIARRYRSA
jgi:hypothetical protein